ncbi:Uncharacterised protein [Legionella lansingensis]|uniref:CAAX amino terminal protease self-immunity n=1 Tax=Legionella lansingensis TaxID=45067 RepID=A0A0W0VPT9_9GAMM|nr:CPBP family intramembrane metalloprotease [Legionella lansingensis]KTD22171.1 hypothetical protein Llan_1434 [Legionella lansingensis]SNV54669.1 Uncharacterised protein [Legionella lansingensis]
MQLNWPLIIVICCLALPGVIIAVPRLIRLLLPDNSERVQKRVSGLAIGQTLLMVLILTIAGSVLSLRTGLNAPVLENLLQGKPVLTLIQNMVLPILLCTIGGLVVFFVLYYGLVASILDEATFAIMRKVRTVLALDGCMLYGGVVEEIIARWGLMNVVAFFSILFYGQKTPLSIWIAILLSGFLVALGQLPAYLAAGCHSGRRFVYSVLLLNIWQAIVFGWLFWQFGLFAAIVSHMLFHVGWFLYDKT